LEERRNYWIFVTETVVTLDCGRSELGQADEEGSEQLCGPWRAFDHLKDVNRRIHIGVQSGLEAAPCGKGSSFLYASA
jgi:hypothetical protein